MKRSSSTNELYLTPRAIASKLKGARQWGESWTARCPTHNDSMASLKISKGRKATMIYCHAGCTTADILTELGWSMAMLYYNYDPNSTHHSNSAATLKLQQMVRDKKPRTMRELMPAQSLEDVLYRVLPSTAEVWTWVRLRWLDWFLLPYPEAMRKHWIVTDAICADLMVNEIDQGYDYSVAERHRMRDTLEDTWERLRPVTDS